MPLTASIAALTITSIALIVQLIAVAWAVITLQLRKLGRAAAAAIVLLVVHAALAVHIGAAAGATYINLG